MSLPIPIFLLVAGASWALVGLFYLIQIRRYAGRPVLLRRKNYRHFSHLLISGQFVATMAAAGTSNIPHQMKELGQLAGSLLVLGGLVLCIHARHVLGPYWDKHATIKVRHALITRGPYRICRNPIFLGQLGMFLGVSLASFSWVAWICSALAFWSFRRRAIIEEATLSAYFGAEYDSYTAMISRFGISRPTRIPTPTPVRAPLSGCLRSTGGLTLPQAERLKRMDALLML